MDYNKIIGIVLIGCVSIAVSYFFYQQVRLDLARTYSSQEETLNSNTNSSHSLIPLRSNQWYSTLYKDFPTNPIYAYPLVYKVTKEGLAISYPSVTADEKTIFATYDEDFVIGFTSQMERPQITSIGDWNVSLDLRSVDNESMSVNIIHGSPYINIDTHADENIILKSKKNITYFQPGNITEETKVSNTNEIIIKIDSNYYYLRFKKEATINYSTNELSISKPEKITVALLDRPENYTLFKDLHEIETIYTKASYTISENKLTTTYTYKEKTNRSTLTTVLPHHYNYFDDQPEVLGEYKTLRGPAKLVDVTSFKTSIPLRTPDVTFIKATKNQSVIIDQLREDIKLTISEPVPDSKNYFLGTWFGKVTTLIQLADVYGLQQEKQQLIDYVTPIFLDSLTYHTYDETKKSVIAQLPEFGNDEYNDHHFHYGYYIRLGAILISEETPNESEITDTINQMVLDIANTDRASNKYPYIRNFDTYEGHSWADGFGDANDGNNQESTSEAINAWYSIYLWGKATENAELVNTGLYLYNTEITSTLQYWFDIDDIYDDPYGYNIASIVWGGKVDFTTWFSPEPNMIYGIQLLPVTPASDYLSLTRNFSVYESDFLSAGGSYSNEWGDLLLIWKSYHEPLQISDIPEDIKLNDRVPRSLLLHMLSQ